MELFLPEIGCRGQAKPSGLSFPRGEDTHRKFIGSRDINAQIIFYAASDNGKVKGIPGQNGFAHADCRIDDVAGTVCVADAFQGEFGRASCRERVCLSVWGLVLAVYLKK